MCFTSPYSSVIKGSKVTVNKNDITTAVTV